MRGGGGEGADGRGGGPVFPGEGSTRFESLNPSNSLLKASSFNQVETSGGLEDAVSDSHDVAPHIVGAGTGPSAEQFQI